MSVNQCTKENATSKGYRWYYQVYYFDENGKQIKYHSKKFATRKEAQVAEANRLRKMRRKEINITDMTFIELYEEFYEYKSDKVKETTLKSYRERINSLEPIHNVKLKILILIITYLGEDGCLKEIVLLKLKMDIINSLKRFLIMEQDGMISISHKYIIKWKNL